jgi:feruloyl-CoA synthase
VGPLRSRIIEEFGPYVRDVVIAGADRDYIAALVFPDLEACRKLCNAAADVQPAVICADPRLRATFASLLRKFAAENVASSTRVRRLVLLADLPSLDAGEMTDKGTINQSAVLNYRSDVVAGLYREPPSDGVLAVDEPIAEGRILPRLMRGLWKA